LLPNNGADLKTPPPSEGAASSTVADRSIDESFLKEILENFAQSLNTPIQQSLFLQKATAQKICKAFLVEITKDLAVYVKEDGILDYERYERPEEEPAAPSKETAAIEREIKKKQIWQAFIKAEGITNLDLNTAISSFIQKYTHSLKELREGDTGAQAPGLYLSVLPKPSTGSTPSQTSNDGGYFESLPSHSLSSSSFPSSSPSSTPTFFIPSIAERIMYDIIRSILCDLITCADKKEQGNIERQKKLAEEERKEQEQIEIRQKQEDIVENAIRDLFTYSHFKYTLTLKQRNTFLSVIHAIVRVLSVVETFQQFQQLKDSKNKAIIESTADKLRKIYRYTPQNLPGKRLTKMVEHGNAFKDTTPDDKVSIVGSFINDAHSDAGFYSQPKDEEIGQVLKLINKEGFGQDLAEKDRKAKLFKIAAWLCYHLVGHQDLIKAKGCNYSRMTNPGQQVSEGLDAVAYALYWLDKIKKERIQK
jgi:hypothetical protein